jgi:hypothetical protein
MKSKDQVQLEEAYQSVHEAISSGRARGIDAMHFTNQHDKHSDQGDYQAAAGGARTSTYKTVQPGMGKKDKLSEPQMQAALAILQQYAQGDISNVEAAEMFEDLHKKGTAGTNSYPQHSDQEDPVQLGDGRVTSKYKTAQPGMGKR